MPTYLASALPDLDLAETSTLTVDALDTDAIIESVAVHFRQDTPAALLEAAGLPPLFSYVPTPVPA